MINRKLSNGDVILLSYKSAGDIAATLAHEIGHYINRSLGGLDRYECLSSLSLVTKTMSRVARFDECFLQNKDEFYAETWSHFLLGHDKSTLFRYLDRPLKRLRMKHPAKLRMIEECRKMVSSAKV